MNIDQTKLDLNRRFRPRFAVFAILAGAASAFGQSPAPAPVESPPPPGSVPPETFDEKLIHMLQKHNAISREDA